VTLDWAALRAIARMTDPDGVLSIYVTLDPQWRAEPAVRPPWELRLRHELADIRDALREHGSRTHAKAVTARLDALGVELDRLLDPTATGQGRALFAGVASGESRTVSLQVPLVDRVVLEPQPYLRPLLAAWSNAGPAGVVSVSADEVRLVDLRFGRTDLVDTIAYERPPEQRSREGPAASILAQSSVSQHDLYERREDDKLLRFLKSVGPRLAAHGAAREWGYLVLTGEAALVQAVRDGLPPTPAAEVLTLDTVNSLPPPKLAAAVAPALDEARQRHHRELAEWVRASALSANTGSCGLGETLWALQEGRVAHLLLDADRQWSGTRAPDGLLAPTAEIPPGADPEAVRSEPRLGERMVELALRNGARVTMLAAAAAAPLADADGVGAVLRW
jgi:hypothetical protein